MRFVLCGIISTAGGVSSLPFGNGITESHGWNNLLEQTSISAGNLLTLGYNYCNNGTSQCSTGNTGSPFQHTIGWAGSRWRFRNISTTR